jgi:hypothetical protein
VDHILNKKTKHEVPSIRGVQVQLEEVIMTAMCSLDRGINTES